MAFIAAVVAFLALLSCAGAQAPAPAPLKQNTPVPVPVPVQPTPSPLQEAAPAPMLSGSPPTVPVQQSAPTPAPPQEAAPAPMLSGAPPAVPVHQSAPTPAPPQEAAPAPMLSGAPPKGSPGAAAPAPTFYVGSPEGASAPTSDQCLNALTNLSACLTYVMAGSNLTAPDEGCCPALAGLVESNPICLCQLFGKSNSFGIDLDTAKAMKLPSVCNVTTPPLSTCALVGIPVGAPGIGQMAPGASPIPLGEPSTATASPPESSKSSSSFRISVTVFLIGLWAGVAAVF